VVGLARLSESLLLQTVKLTPDACPRIVLIRKQKWRPKTRWFYVVSKMGMRKADGEPQKSIATTLGARGERRGSVDPQYVARAAGSNGDLDLLGQSVAPNRILCLVTHY
jgi:hypothetical protein